MPKRRRWDSKTKARIVLEVIGGVLSPAEACRKYELAESVLSRWKREFLEKAHLVFDSGGSVGAGHNREVEELQQMLGKQAVELEALKKGVRHFGASQREAVVKVLKAENPQYPTRMLSRLFELARSSLYRSLANPARIRLASQEDQTARLLELAGRWPCYGYRRLTAEMRRAGYPINSKKTRRLMRALGIQGPGPKRKARTTWRDPGLLSYPNLVLNLEITYPEQVWVADVTYIGLKEEFVYLAIIMDVYTRQIRGWHLLRSLEQGLTLTALNKALLHHPPPQIHHSDQGVQYTSQLYLQILAQNKVQVSNSAVGQAWQNGYAERLVRTIKEEEVGLQDYQNFGDAIHNIKTFIEEVYGKKRIHSSLGYLTPAEFEAYWKNQQEVTKIEPLVVSK